MADPRLRRWAEVLVRYSVGVKAGDKLAISGPPLAAPLLTECYREALRVGAYPDVISGVPGLQEIFLREANEEQLKYISPLQELVIGQFDATLQIMADENTRELAGADPARQAIQAQAHHSLVETFMRRQAVGDLKWSLTLYPTNAYAQDAGMSLADFTEFVYEACFLNDEDPVARWKELGAKQQRLVDWLKGKDQIHVVAKDTDLHLSVKDRIFINADGQKNFPDGEFFTGPVEDSVNGHIRFTLPAMFQGRPVEGVRVRFEAGQVVEATADVGQDLLEQMLNMDDGAKRLGEFAFGNNFGISRGIKNILFDEKIGGSVHMALGAGYPDTGSKNESALHWDMICDLRDGGEVWVDGQLFNKNGQFVV
ncbi:MAG TPA: aminopeptidase [Ktedonobacterales bacterium]|nr:aminopeptidase [Ktedonobacterales bacterium]